jgi:hypothetical protein
MQTEPYGRRGILAIVSSVIFASRRLVSLVMGMISPLFGLGTVLYQYHLSTEEGKGEKLTFMIPVNMKLVVMLMLHSILSTFSCVIAGGSSAASSHFSLWV